MSQILKFPDIVSRRTPKDGTPEEAVAGTEAKLPSLPIMTGDQWNEFIRLLTPEEQRAFMADVWKLITSTAGALAATEGRLQGRGAGNGPALCLAGFNWAALLARR